MSEDRVRFDRIDYVILGSNDVPVQKSCPTFYERFPDGRPASQFEFEASRDFFELLPGWLADIAGSAPPSFGSMLDKTARSATLFCQQVCNRVFGDALVTDGVWGDKTQAAMDRAQARIGISGDLAAHSSAWREWLREVAEIALQGRMAP